MTVPVRVPLVDLRAQHARIAGEVLPAVMGVVEDQGFVLGPVVAAFERTLADLCGVPHAVGVASGSDALYLALRALGIGTGDVVVTTPLSFVATAEAIVRTGARPAFCDVDPATGNLAPAAVAARLAQLEAAGLGARALLPVHLFGRPCAMEALADLAARADLRVLEDAAQAVGAHIEGRPVGSLGHAAALSFFPAKNLGAWGDGGAVVSRDAEVAERVRSLRIHGSRDLTGHHEYAEVGLNSRLDALQAAVLEVKARHLAAWNAARVAAAARYRALLAPVAEHLTIPPHQEGHVYHQFVVRTERRDALAAHLRGAGVETRAYYTIPLHRQPALRAHAVAPAEPLPAAEAAARTLLALPIFPEISEAQQALVAETAAAFFGR